MSDETKLRGNCKHCGNKLKFPAHMAGTEVACPHCKAVTVLQPAATVALVTAPVSAPKPPPDAEPAQPQNMSCPACREEIEADDLLCIHCGYRIPRPINWVRWGAIGLMVLQLTYFTLRWNQLDPRVQHAFKVTIGLASAGTYSGGTAIPSSSATDSNATTPDGNPVPAAPPPETGAPRLAFSKQPVLKEEGTFYYISGSVKNNSATDPYFEVTVKFQIQDAQGQPLGVVQDYKAFLDPGKTWDFRVLVIDPDARNYTFLGPIGGVR
ncbi:MAG: hypothetical protein CMO74_13115 [Verrucomicrobiales bacterium]|nr:hypothetical protein [Verrucomicrobiales bacterium]|tara:strand:- start:626 stop:1426 length:801 start_codon:yes stop_codon:yes gene_type:complete